MLTSAGGRPMHRLGEDWLKCMGYWLGVRWVMTCSILVKEFRRRIVLIQMLFRNEFVIMVKRLCVHLFIWK